MPRKRKKKFSPDFRSYLTKARKIKKIKKTSFRHYFQSKRYEIGRQREKKILVPNSVPKHPVLENSKKKKKKIQKIREINSGIIYIQIG